MAQTSAAESVRDPDSGFGDGSFTSAPVTSHGDGDGDEIDNKYDGVYATCETDPSTDLGSIGKNNPRPNENQGTHFVLGNVPG